MSVVAVYNMKGGVGKTTMAVNVSHLAAASGHRVLLWDLDPQSASSFAFRVQPRVPGFGKKTLRNGDRLVAAIRETDYRNLDLLPADFAYRKLDRLLDRLDKPAHFVTRLLDTLGRHYDVVLLDCPPGFSLLTECVFAAADAVLVPTIPTVLSLRTLARLVKWADRSDSPPEIAAFFSMVDRRKTLHRRACDWSVDHPALFLSEQVPYASIVEQMAVRRMPLAAFAAYDPASRAFARIWTELQTRLGVRREGRERLHNRWPATLQAIEALIVQLESARTPAMRVVPQQFSGSPEDGDVDFVHTFDTDLRDLQRGGYVLELRERPGSLLVVAAQSDTNGGAESKPAQAQVDGWWATQILTGEMSPLAALQRRLGSPVPQLVESVDAVVNGRRLHRIESRVGGNSAVDR